MKKLKRRGLIPLLLVLSLLLSGCVKEARPSETEAGKNLIVVGFSQVGAESDWRNANTLSMTRALSEENGYRLIFDDAQNKQERQITAIRNFIQMGVDYIVLAPTTETGWDTVLSEAKAAGIPVILVDRMIEAVDYSQYTCWVGSDFKNEGRQAVQWLEENFPSGPLRIVHLQGNLGSSAQLGRTGALDEALEKHPEWQVVCREPGDFTQAKGQEIMEQVLRDGLEFDVLYSENDNMAFGAIDALNAAGIVPGRDVTVISFDAGHRALRMTMEGSISFDVECNPLHGPRVQSIIESLESGKIPPKLTFVEESCFDGSLTEEELAKREY